MELERERTLSPLVPCSAQSPCRAVCPSLLRDGLYGAAALVRTSSASWFSSLLGYPSELVWEMRQKQYYLMVSGEESCRFFLVWPLPNFSISSTAIKVRLVQVKPGQISSIRNSRHRGLWRRRSRRRENTVVHVGVKRVFIFFWKITHKYELVTS